MAENELKLALSHPFAVCFGITQLNPCFILSRLLQTGITKRKSLEYTVSSLSGHLECIHIKIEKSQAIAIESEEMKPPNGHSKYALYGIANSSNNAFLLGAYFAGRVSVSHSLLSTMFDNLPTFFVFHFNSPTITWHYVSPAMLRCAISLADNIHLISCSTIPHTNWRKCTICAKPYEMHNFAMRKSSKIIWHHIQMRWHSPTNTCIC